MKNKEKTGRQTPAGGASDTDSGLAEEDGVLSALNSC